MTILVGLVLAVVLGGIYAVDAVHSDETRAERVPVRIRRDR